MKGNYSITEEREASSGTGQAENTPDTDGGSLYPGSSGSRGEGKAAEGQTCSR